MPVPVNVLPLARVTTLPAPVAAMVAPALLAMLLLRARVAPFVAFAVPLLTKLLLVYVSAPPVALMVPLLVRIEPLPDSKTLPKPINLLPPPMIRLSLVV